MVLAAMNAAFISCPCGFIVQPQLFPSNVMVGRRQNDVVVRAIHITFFPSCTACL